MAEGSLIGDGGVWTGLRQMGDKFCPQFGLNGKYTSPEGERTSWTRGACSRLVCLGLGGVIGSPSEHSELGDVGADCVRAFSSKLTA